MSKNSMRFMSDLVFQSNGVSAPAKVRSAPLVVTGQSDETLKLFAGIHNSKRFTVDAAHQSFAGLKRKK